METYDEIYGRMKNAYEHETGDSFNEVSDIAIRLKVLAGEIFKLQTNLEWWKRQMFAVSASGECLDKLASQRGIERKKAMKSTGEITFNISQPCSHDIVIPKGCVVATADLVPIRFVTTEDEEISAGNTLVSVYAEAEQTGSNGNIGLGCAVVPVSVPTEIETVTNREKFSGGCDAETDDELRKRIRDTYINTSNGTNAAYYEQLALTVDGVAKASAVGKVRDVGTVNVYVTGADASLGTNVVAKVQSLLEKQRELNVDVIVSNAQRIACNMSVVAYAEGLNTEFDMLETMERELFIDTAENCGITERERFVGKINADYPLEKRREMLKISEQKVGGKCTPDDFKRIVRGYGVENFTIAEAPTRNRVDIKISDTKTDAEKKLIEKRVKADFPLHLNVIISYVNA